MSEFINEPVTLGLGYEQEEPGVYIADASGVVIISSDVQLTEQRARRIVACVNACAGIPTEHLELCNAVLAVDSIIKDRNAMQNQRDELLSMLETVLRHFTKTPSSLADTTVRGDAHALIAKVKGGEA